MNDEKLYVFLIGAVILFTMTCLASLAIAYCCKERHNKDKDFIIHSPSPNPSPDAVATTSPA